MSKHTQAIIFISSLLFSLCIWFFLFSMKPPMTWEYSDIAKNLIINHKFAYEHLNTEYLCFCPPLFTFLTAFIYLLTSFNNFAVVFAQIVIFSFLCTCIFIIGRNIFGYKIGLLAAVCVMLHPGMLFYTLRNVHSLVLDSFMMTFSVLTMLMLYDKPGSLKRLVLSAVVLGLSFLSRGTTLILLPIFVLWVIFAFKQPLKKRLIISICLIILSFAVMLGWNIRNYFATGDFILVGAATEESLWLGNNPQATGSSYTTPGKLVLMDLSGKDFLDRIYMADEMRQRKIFKDSAFNFIKNNPGQFLILFIKKIYYFWWFSPQTGIEYPKTYTRIYKTAYSFILFFAVLGVIFSVTAKQLKIKKSALLLLAVFFSISVFQSFFYVEGRHRWGIEPMLLVFTAYGIFAVTAWMETCLKTKI